MRVFPSLESTPSRLLRTVDSEQMTVVRVVDSPYSGGPSSHSRCRVVSQVVWLRYTTAVLFVRKARRHWTSIHNSVTCEAIYEFRHFLLSRNSLLSRPQPPSSPPDCGPTDDQSISPASPSFLCFLLILWTWPLTNGIRHPSYLSDSENVSLVFRISSVHFTITLSNLSFL